MYTDRFNYFINEILPHLRASTHGNTLIFIPQYFDYISLRNYFDDNLINFRCCSEYSKGAEISRARADLFNGKTDFVLFTERFHYFKR